MHTCSGSWQLESGSVHPGREHVAKPTEFLFFHGKLAAESLRELLFTNNPFPLIINDVPPPHPPVIINHPGCQNLFIIRGAYLLKGFGRAALKFFLKSLTLEVRSR